MATDQQFCLRWNNHQSTLISVFDSLLENGTLVDCTLAAEGKYLKAHKVVLSACSPYLETLLSQHYEKHPIVILKDVKFTELKSMMDYMYRGEVNISQDQLGTFLKAAESLQIKGLSDNGDDATGPTTKRQEASARPSVTEVRNVETKRPAPSADLSDASREGSISPSSLRKRRRTRRSSQGDDPDSHLDSTSNACDFPINTSQTTTPLSVPSTTVVPTPVQNLPKQIVKQEPSISRIDNLNSTIAPESGLLKEKIEPPSEPLLEPKTEYLDYMNNENSIEVEDLTLDDDEDLDSSMDASRPGPSHGDMSNQGYQWPMGDQSGTDEIFMAAQQAVGAATGQQRDSQVTEVVTGKRRGSTIYLYQNFTYRKNREVGEKLYVRCCSLDCPGSGYILHGTVTMLMGHNHDPDVERANTLRLRQDLRNSVVENRSESKRSIFNAVCQRHPDAAALTTFRSSRDFMHRERIAKLPPEAHCLQKTPLKSNREKVIKQPHCPRKTPLKSNRKRITKHPSESHCLRKTPLRSSETPTRVVEAPNQVETPVQVFAAPEPLSQDHNYII